MEPGGLMPHSQGLSNIVQSTHIKKMFCITSVPQVPEPLHTNGTEIHTKKFRLFLLLMKTIYCMVYRHIDRLSEVVVQIAIHTNTSNTQ